MKSRALTLLVVTMLWPATSLADTTFSYRLNAPATTSAGAFKPDGTLVRTLWRKVDKPAGLDTRTWDDKDDDGNPLPAGTYEIRVLRHDTKYVWEGAVGNTGDMATGPTVPRAFLPIHDMACVAGTCFMAMAYNEGQHSMKRFTIGAPQRHQAILHPDAFTGFEYVATDGTTTYWGNNGGFGSDTFVVGTKVSDDSEMSFANGKPVCLNYNGSNCYPEQDWGSVLDHIEGGGATALISGLAVQKTGGLLFVAHEGRNEVHVVDKTSGASVRTVAVSSPRRPAVDAADHLWMIVGTNGGDAVQRFTIASDGALTPGPTLPGLVAPRALAISPDGKTILVADGGTSQQVKAYSTETLAAGAVLGVAGGYASGPEVTNDKWIFDDGTFIAYQPDGTFWVGESANRRVQHWDAQNTFIDRIMYLPHSYSAGVDATNPTRVFSDFLELRVDYTKPVRESWELARNWSARIPSKYLGFARGMGNTRTLSNGRTYAALGNNEGRLEIVELPASGFLRETGLELPNKEGLVTFADNGDLRWVEIEANVQKVFVRTLTGFDAQGNPEWAPPVLHASTPVKDGDPIAGNLIGPWQLPISSSNVAVSFAPHKSTGFHLGGLAKDGTQWLWRASPTGLLDGLGTFEIDEPLNYGGNIVHASGRNIVFGYHGEFWRNSQASQWMHFHDDGLFVGQFGTYGNTVTLADGATAGFSGNSFASGMVKVNCQTYLWHNDESNHAGVVRWRIDGLDDIREVSGSGALGSTFELTNESPAPPVCVPETPSAVSDAGAEGAAAGALDGQAAAPAAATANGNATPNDDEGGIGCRTGAGNASGSPALWIGSLMALVYLRRRSRRA